MSADEAMFLAFALPLAIAGVAIVAYACGQLLRVLIRKP